MNHLIFSLSSQSPHCTPDEGAFLARSSGGHRGSGSGPWLRWVWDLAALLSLAVPCFAAHAAPAPASKSDASAPLRFVLATLEHDHAWWTMDHIRETPGVELVGLFDRQEHLREKARKRLTNSVPLFDDA